MIIEKKIYSSILNKMPIAPPEIGGIIGGKNEVISAYQIDKGTILGGCSYKPDVNRLNMVIEKWRMEGIRFYGVFHTHFFDVKTLSKGDIYYINKIMNVMPASIKELYFPIVVMPVKQMVSYKAVRDEKILIIEEIVEFEDQGCQ